MKRVYLSFFIFSLIYSCQKKDKDNSEIENQVDSVNIESIETIENVTLIETETIKHLPIHGKLNEIKLKKYYPNILDTISDKRIFGSEKLELNSGNEIIVSLLHNTGTFDQMILCTHDNNFKLVDNIYIGKATQFDNGKSLTINHTIENNNQISFDLVEWGYVNEDIDTINHEKLLIKIDNFGKLKVTN